MPYGLKHLSIYFCKLAVYCGSPHLGGLLMLFQNQLMESAHGYVFLNYIFSGNGIIIAWQFYVKRVNIKARICVIRPSLYNYVKVGCNDLNGMSKGLHRVEIPEPSRIEVQSGDMIGVSYDDNTLVFSTTDNLINIPQKAISAVKKIENDYNSLGTSTEVTVSQETLRKQSTAIQAIMENG